MSPLLALKKAIVARLLADATLVAMLGGPNVFEEVPRAALPPYLVLGETRARDWSTGTDQGHEHEITLQALSRQPGATEALAIADRVAIVLHDQALVLEGHRLVNLRMVASEVRREGREPQRRAVLRLRAVTEVT